MDGAASADGTEESIIETNSETTTINDELTSTEFCAKFLLTNARSLTPKVDSLVHAFGSLGLHFAGITETWFKGGRKLEEGLDDIEGATGIKIIHRSRDGRKKHHGGGVALAFNKFTSNFKARKMGSAARKHEIVCGVGKVNKITRVFAVFVIYVPPNTRAGEMEAICDALSEEIIAVKLALKNPIVIVGGDLNNRDISEAIKDTDDFEPIVTGPTRGDNTLDIMYCNTIQGIAECGTVPPLTSNTGMESDHKCVWAELVMPTERQYKWEVHYARRRSERANEAFAQELCAWDWSTLRRAVGPDAKVAILEKTLSLLTDKHFPRVRVRKRSSEPPWITNRIRKLYKKKCRIYKNGGRTQAWWATDTVLQEEIAESREMFVEKTLEDGTNGKSFYEATKSLAAPGAPPRWKVQDLFQDTSPESMCEQILDYFGGIAGTEPLRGQDHPKVTGGLPTFSTESVTEILKKAKKTESKVDGDPLPHLVRAYPHAFAIPVADIYNAVNETAEWPQNWKTEHLTIIPKVPNPKDLSECRNISCTSLFSKILENQLMEKLRSELTPDPQQFGGEPGCGAEHMLVQIWDKVLEAMEGGQTAAVLLGVDFEKAFNRMEHAVCLDNLVKLGASPGSVSLVAAFLKNRRMTIRIGEFSANPRTITKGSPQGSVLGSMLYCTATQLLTEELRLGRAVERPPRSPQAGHLADQPQVPGIPTVPDRVGDAVRFFPQDSSDEEDAIFWQHPVAEGNERRRNISEHGVVDGFKYIDDTTLFTPVDISLAKKHFTVGTTVQILDNIPLEPALAELDRRATEIGMKINQKKTQLLAICPPNGCRTEASMTGPDGSLIEAVTEMKLVGFHFGQDPGVGTHVAHLRGRYRQKVWMLYHLREAGLRGTQLFGLYAVYVRSILEYCSPAYHSLLNRGQAEALERINRNAVRICHGLDAASEDGMADLGIETLESRRIRRCDAFLTKAFRNPRFAADWFPSRGEDVHNLRNRRQIEETNARTLRRFTLNPSAIKLQRR